MSTEISEQAKIAKVSTLSKFFIDGAAGFFSNSDVAPAKIKQLVLSAVLAADTAIENNDAVDWKHVDVPKFTNDMFRLVGMGIDFANKEAYIVPYRNPKTGKYDLTTPVSADGLVKLAKLYSIRPIKDFQKYVVREGDDISVEYGENKSWSYKPKLFNTGTVLGYLTVVVFEDGDFDAMITTLEEVEARRKASKAPNSPAWTKFPLEMGLAKSARKHMKRFAINLPSDISEEPDFEPMTKDMGDVSAKIELDYPALVEAQTSEKATEDTVRMEDVDFTGTPFENM